MKYQTICEPREKITEVCANIALRMLQNVRNEFFEMGFYYQEVLGTYFEKWL